MQHLHATFALDGTTITFDAVGESVVLVYHNTIGWKTVSLLVVLQSHKEQIMQYEK